MSDVKSFDCSKCPCGTCRNNYAFGDKSGKCYHCYSCNFYYGEEDMSKFVCPNKDRNVLCDESDFKMTAKEARDATDAYVASMRSTYIKGCVDKICKDIERSINSGEYRTNFILYGSSFISNKDLVVYLTDYFVGLGYSVKQNVSSDGEPKSIEISW